MRGGTQTKLAVVWRDIERRNQLLDLLTALGYQPSAAPDDLDQLRDFELIVAEHELVEPHFDGELLHDIACLVVGPDDLAAAVSSLRAGALDYLTHDVVESDSEELSSRLSGALEAGRARLERSRPKPSREAAELEQELTKQAEALERIQEVAHVGVWVWTILTGDLEWTDEIYRIFGRQREQFEPTYEHFLETIHPQDRDAVAAAVNSAVAGEAVYSIEHRLVRPDGQIYWVHERGRVDRSETGEPVRMLGTVYDISAIRAAKEERLGYARLLEDATNELYILDAGTLTLLHVNNQAVVNLGYTAEALLRMSMSDLIPETTGPDFERLLEPIRIGDSDRLSLHIVLRRRDGNTYPVEAFLHRSVFAGQPVLAVLCYDRSGIEEAEERKRLVAELERKNTEMERFTYTVSHDLKSPLITIRGFMSLLRQDLAEENQDAIAEDMDHIELGATAMSNLLDELLALSRVGRVANPPDRVGLGAIFQEAAQRLSAVVEKQGAELRIDPDLPVVDVDRSRMVEVAQNLLENAVKYAGEQSPRIDVSAVPGAPHSVRVRVRDNGVGIEPRFQRKVFELFERLDTSFEGTGIGLSLVQRIVEVHGGRVWVESEGLNQGSSFFIELPAISDALADDAGDG